MKAFISDYKYNIFLSFVELIVAVFLFINPVGLGRGIIIFSGILFSVWGAFKIRGYFTSELEKGKHVRGLSIGVLLISIGMFFAIQSSAVQNAISSVMALFGVIMLAICALKSELAVGMLRLQFGNVLWMTISAAYSLAISILLLCNIFAMTGIPWILTGISYVIGCGLDITTMVIKPKAAKTQEAAEA